MDKGFTMEITLKWSVGTTTKRGQRTCSPWTKGQDQRKAKSRYTIVEAQCDHPRFLQLPLYLVLTSCFSTTSKEVLENLPRIGRRKF